MDNKSTLNAASGAGQDPAMRQPAQNGSPLGAGVGEQNPGQKGPAATGGNGAGVLSFIKSIFKSGKNEQRPDETLAETFNKAMHGKKSSLFDAMNAPLHGLKPDDIAYANEVDAALARRPRFSVRFLSVIVFLMFLCLIAWSAFADIDEVTHSDGQIVASQRTQTIQNLEGGILRGIQVREGQIVEKGALLAQLDNEVAESSYRDAVSKAIENRLAIIRLESELRNEKPQFPEDLKGFLTRRLGHAVDNRTLGRARELLHDQQYTWEYRQDQLKADREVLQAQYDQRMHDVAEQEAHHKQLLSGLSLAREQLGVAGELMRRKNYARMEYLNLEQKVVDLQGQVDMLAASIPKARAGAEEAKQRMASQDAERRAAILQEITKRRLELTSHRETISAGGDRVTRTELRSPVRGTVKQIHINTVGGVIKPGEPIMDIVPLDDTLLVESRVAPKDVAFLRPGQDVMIKVSAYDFSIYGGLEGKLESISADTIEDKKGELHYVAKIRTPKTAIIHNDEVLPIIPGMMVTADILIGKKTVLDYLLKPILKAKQNALRER